MSMEGKFLWMEILVLNRTHQTSHNAFYDFNHNLWATAQNKKVLVEAIKFSFTARIPMETFGYLFLRMRKT